MTRGLALLLALAACRGGEGAAAPEPDGATVTITGAAGAHRFRAEVADTADEQRQGLMFRTDLGPDDAMLFAPYPPQGGPPQAASFWMKNTPTPLDIIYVRADRTIARIAENTTPFSEQPIPSGEPVAAVLEVRGGRTAELGVAEGDKVDWSRGS